MLSVTKLLFTAGEMDLRLESWHPSFTYSEELSRLGVCSGTFLSLSAHTDTQIVNIKVFQEMNITNVTKLDSQPA